MFEKKGAIKVFYYLVAIDGEVDSDKLEKFEEIGKEIDEAAFDEYKASLIEECQIQMRSIIDEEDYYDVIQEGIDEAPVRRIDDPSQGVCTRLLVWNMLAIAFNNYLYSDVERKWIAQIFQLTYIDMWYNNNYDFDDIYLLKFIIDCLRKIK